MIHYKDYLDRYASTLQAKLESPDQTTADNIITFDIETTSIYFDDDRVAEVFDFDRPAEYWLDKHKSSICYIWQAAIDGIAVYGRHLDEWIELTRTLRELIGKDLLVWVHNLPFEFQHLRRLYEWDKVNAREIRRPYCARTVEGIEYRCTYALCNMSLAALAKAYDTPHKKLVGDLDYYALRTPDTPLTEQELAYCENDVLVLHDYIDQFPRPLSEIPLTQTGFIRREVKSRMGKRICHINARHNEIDIEQFRTLNRAYAGGYTHANALHAARIQHDIVSYDFTSSYPYVMLSETYPVSRFEQTGRGTHWGSDDPSHCYLYDIILYGYRCKTWNTYISANKCMMITGAVLDNGRVRSADAMRLVLTDADVGHMIDTGSWDEIEHVQTLVADRGRLPRSLWQYILDLYKDKTELKGVAGCEDEYRRAKQYINSLYGMAVTNTVRPDVIYDREWQSTNDLTPEQIHDKLLDNVKFGFMDYAVGVWVTAHARRNLWDAIVALDDVILYCDTDSIKCFDVPRVHDYVAAYNKRVDEKLYVAANYYGADPAAFAPEDINGITHPIGYFDLDGEYKRFITLGAKKYAYDNDDGSGVHITVAGVPKAYGRTIARLEDFKAGLIFYPTRELSKSLAHYDDEGGIVIVDGKLWEIPTGLCLQPTSYALDMPREYRDKWRLAIGK